SSHQPGPHLSGDLRNGPEPITRASRDSASATEQVGLFRVTADAMAHRPLQEELPRTHVSRRARQGVRPAPLSDFFTSLGRQDASVDINGPPTNVGAAR